jgi:aminomethyltransferase
MKQTVLHQKQLQLKTKMSDFQGWQIPIQYSDVQDEYYSVRTAAGLFDIGFLSRVEISGPGSTDLLQKIFPRNLSKIAEGVASYTFICNESGFILNDGIIFHLPDNRFLLTTNPINSEKIIHWLNQHSPDNVQISDSTQTVAQFSLQGPRSLYVLEKLAAPNFKKLKQNGIREMTISNTTVIVSRTGFTGEHGYEFFIPLDRAEVVWEEILSAGSEVGILPCGFACRDTLRLEMGYLLYGNEINETRSPFEAGLESYIDFKKDFIGKDALLKISADKTKQKLVGFELFDKGVPNSGGSIFSENREIGTVTSGGQSPYVRKGFGLGYVASRYAQSGQEIEIEVKDREIAAKIVELPFYRRK